MSAPRIIESAESRSRMTMKIFHMEGRFCKADKVALELGYTYGILAAIRRGIIDYTGKHSASHISGDLGDIYKAAKASNYTPYQAASLILNIAREGRDIAHHAFYAFKGILEQEYLSLDQIATLFGVAFSTGYNFIRSYGERSVMFEGFPEAVKAAKDAKVSPDQFISINTSVSNATGVLNGRAIARAFEKCKEIGLTPEIIAQLFEWITNTKFKPEPDSNGKFVYRMITKILPWELENLPLDEMIRRLEQHTQAYEPGWGLSYCGEV